MTIIFLILILLIFSNIQFAKEETFFTDYLSLSSTKSNKGIFVALIFLSHYKNYLDVIDKYGAIYANIQNFHKQLVVTVFLFYSGYGILKSIENKGAPYVKKLPLRAFTQLWHCHIAILFFLIVNLLLDIKMNLKQVLLSFVLWTSVGNSNWYMFAIILLYLFSFIAFCLPIKNKIFSACIVTALSVLLVVILMPYRDTYCYNTIICYPLGMWYGIFQSRFEKIVWKNDFMYFVPLLLFFMAFCLSYNRRDDAFIFYEIWVICFTIFFILLSMKIKITNPVLDFLGQNIFPIYMLQRIPMIILKHKGTMDKQPYLSFIICLLSTIILCYIYNSIIKIISNITDKKKA